jgi:hypothetical protein
MCSSGRQRWFWFCAGLALAAGCSEFPVAPLDVGVEEGTSDVADVEDSGEDAAQDGGGGGGPCTQSAECDDGAFCNGRELCAPDDPGADTRGCVAGEPPSVDDGIDCTADGCDDAGDQILHDPSACACLVPGGPCDCERNPEVCPTELGACAEVRCSDALTCVAAPVDVGS